jgi:hypothetical protein
VEDSLPAEVDGHMVDHTALAKEHKVQGPQIGEPADLTSLACLVGRIARKIDPEETKDELHKP